MFWRYTRHETKALLIATLCTFSGYGLLLVQDWQDVSIGFQGAQSIAVGAGVAENEVNTYMQTLTERERALVLRENAMQAALVERDARDRSVVLLVSIVGSVLLGLILLNFYFDSKRRLSLA